MKYKEFFLAKDHWTTQWKGLNLYRRGRVLKIASLEGSGYLGVVIRMFHAVGFTTTSGADSDNGWIPKMMGLGKGNSLYIKTWLFWVSMLDF